MRLSLIYFSVLHIQTVPVRRTGSRLVIFDWEPYILLPWWKWISSISRTEVFVYSYYTKNQILPTSACQFGSCPAQVIEVWFLFLFLFFYKISNFTLIDFLFLFFFFFFWIGNLEFYSEKIKREHHVKELAQESKDSLSSIQENHLCQPHI